MSHQEVLSLKGSEIMPIVKYRDFEIVAKKSLYGFDCTIYKIGDRIPRKGNKRGFKGTPVMRDVYVKSLKECRRLIDSEFYGGQTSIEDFGG